MSPLLAITPGEPAGIGLDLIVHRAQLPRAYPEVVLTDLAALSERAAALQAPLQVSEYVHGRPVSQAAGEVTVLPLPTVKPVIAGQLNPANAAMVLQALDRAADGCVSGEFGAMVTGPIQKSVINDAGIPFSGHTEYLAERVGGSPVMMLATEHLRVALATTHLPLSAVADAITDNTLTHVITHLHRDLVSRFGIANPRILVCGLNPHAGEGGHLGREEIDVIEPCLERLRTAGMQLTGPLPADTLFTPHHLGDADAVLAMFHDQGLPVLKYAGFGKAINITLGLPIIRTSVDHGTALDKAGSDRVESGSLDAAIDLAHTLATHAQG